MDQHKEKSLDHYGWSGLLLSVQLLRSGNKVNTDSLDFRGHRTRLECIVCTPCKIRKSGLVSRTLNWSRTKRYRWMFVYRPGAKVGLRKEGRAAGNARPSLVTAWQTWGMKPSELGQTSSRVTESSKIHTHTHSRNWAQPHLSFQAWSEKILGIDIRNIQVRHYKWEGNTWNFFWYNKP